MSDDLKKLQQYRALKMAAADAVKSRWKSNYERHAMGLPVRKHMHHVVDAVATITAKRVELTGNVDLSDEGRKKEMMKVATGEASRVARAERALAAGRESVRKQQLALTPSVKDRSDLASAMLRQETRAAFRRMSYAEQLALMNDPATDSLTLEAIFEASTLLSGVTAPQRDLLLKVVVDRTEPAALATIEEQAESLVVLEAAVRIGKESLRDVVGVAESTFDSWLASVAPADMEAEAAAFKTEIVTQGALSLPRAARTTLVDQLLASNTAELKGAV